MRKYFISNIGNLLFGNICIYCSHKIITNSDLCSDCWNKIKFIHQPNCMKCFLPLPTNRQNIYCPYCIKNKSFFDKAISVCHYNEFMKKMIMQMKYHYKNYLIKIMANFMSQYFKTYLENSDFLISVPMHSKKLINKQFNHTALLNNQISKNTNIPIIHNLLLKTKNTPSQTGIDFKLRHKNITGSFAINPKFNLSLKDLTITIIDDVYTSGATVNQCAKTLKALNPKTINILTLARVC